MCFNKSSSSQSQASNVYDWRTGADNGGLAIGAKSDNNTVLIEQVSDNIAIASIDGQREVSEKTIDTIYESTKNALTTTTDVIADAFSGFLNASDAQLQRANSNVKASRDFAADLIAENTESSDERLIKIVQYGMGAAVIVVLVQSGFLKDLRGVFK